MASSITWSRAGSAPPSTSRPWPRGSARRTTCSAVRGHTVVLSEDVFHTPVALADWRSSPLLSLDLTWSCETKMSFNSFNWIDRSRVILVNGLLASRALMPHMLHFVQIWNSVFYTVMEVTAAELNCSVSSRQNLLQLGQHRVPHRRLVQRGTSQLPAGAGLPGRNRQQLRHLWHGSPRWSVSLHRTVSLQWKSLQTDSVLGLQVLCSSLTTRGWSSASTTTRLKTTPSTPWGGSPTWAEEPPLERPSDTALATSSSITGHFYLHVSPPWGVWHVAAANWASPQ